MAGKPSIALKYISVTGLQWCGQALPGMVKETNINNKAVASGIRVC